MKKYFIYTLERKNVVFYIGKTTNPEQRLNAHKGYFGNNITLTVIDQYYGNEDTALALETFWIKKYRDLGIEIVNVKQKHEARVVKGYKISQYVYDKAMARAEEQGVSLSTLIERWVELYSEGCSVGPISFSTNPLTD